MIKNTCLRWAAMSAFLLAVAALSLMPLRLRAAPNAMRSGPGQIGRWSGPYALRDRTGPAWLPFICMSSRTAKSSCGKAGRRHWNGRRNVHISVESERKLGRQDANQFTSRDPQRRRAHLLQWSRLFAGRSALCRGGGHGVEVKETRIFDYRTNVERGARYAGEALLPKRESVVHRRVLVAAGQDCGNTAAQRPLVVTASGTSCPNLTRNDRTMESVVSVQFCRSGRAVFRAGGSHSGEGATFDTGVSQRRREAGRCGAGRSTSQDYGSAVMYPAGQIMVLGGGEATAGCGTIPTAVNVTRLIDVNAPDPTWHEGPPMLNARWFPDATLLPDGRVFVTGGGGPSGGVLQSEMLDPGRAKSCVEADGLHGPVSQVPLERSPVARWSDHVGRRDLPERDTAEFYEPPCAVQ
jgi:hypothetical protein